MSPTRYLHSFHPHNFWFVCYEIILYIIEKQRPNNNNNNYVKSKMKFEKTHLWLYAHSLDSICCVAALACCEHEKRWRKKNRKKTFIAVHCPIESFGSFFRQVFIRFGTCIIFLEDCSLFKLHNCVHEWIWITRRDKNCVCRINSLANQSVVLGGDQTPIEIHLDHARNRIIADQRELRESEFIFNPIPY